MKKISNKVLELCKEVSIGFLKQKGRASVYSYDLVATTEIVVTIINRFRVKNPSSVIFIVVEDYKTRMSIINRCNDLNIDRESINIISIDYINIKYKYDYSLIISIGINSNYEMLKFFTDQCKFMLNIMSKNSMNHDYVTFLNNNLQIIVTDVTNADIVYDNVYSPVEEERRGVYMDESDTMLYNDYTKYITECITIFGDIGIINSCRTGNPERNTTAYDNCCKVAEYNGWNVNLDVSIEYCKRIDDVYNPNNIQERALEFYRIAKERGNLIMDNKAKLEMIKQICLDNKGRNILIISKRGEFAQTVSNYLNKDNDMFCGDYHDAIPETTVTDGKGGTLIYKSGKNKGLPRIFKSKAISSHYSALFRNGDINILSMKFNASQDLKLSADILIFTSPLLDDVYTFKSRFKDVKINTVPNLIYKVYCRETTESAVFDKISPNSLITVVNDSNDNIIINKNNKTFIC